MQAIEVRIIQQIVGGKLLYGSTRGVVQAMAHYVAGERTVPKSLLFVRKSDDLRWEAIQAPAVVISNKEAGELKPPIAGVTVLQVPNVLTAMWQVVAYYRSLFQLPVVAITGTCGKTTTKEMLYHVLQKYNVVISDSSQNEPRQSLRYLTRIDGDTDVAVFELGLGNSGNITHQCKMYEPTIGVLLNIGVHHLDGCGDLAGYRKAKGEILDGVNGTLIVNADDAQTKLLPLASFQGKLKTFGVHQAADIRARDITQTARGMRFTVQVAGKAYRAFVAGFGEHQVYNALAVLAVIDALGYSVPHAIVRLRTFTPLSRHLEVKKGRVGSTIIDDTWTTNPTSLEAALKAIAPLTKQKKLIVVLGEMNRLGRFEQHYYEDIARELASYPIELLVTVGKRVSFLAQQAKQRGLRVQHVDQASSIAQVVEPLLARDVVVLVKGPMSSKALQAFVTGIEKEQR